MIIKVGGGLEPLGPIGVYAYEYPIRLQCRPYRLNLYGVDRVDIRL